MVDLLIHSTKILNTLPEIYPTNDSFDIIVSVPSDDSNAFMSYDFVPRGNEYQIMFENKQYYSGRFIRYIDIKSITYVYEKNSGKLHFQGKFTDYAPQRITT